MLLWQLIVQMIILIILVMALNKFLSQFATKKAAFYPLFLVLFMFSTGFAFRLSNNKPLVDFGFFFTEISYLFTYVLFTAALILGQKKYWRIA